MLRTAIAEAIKAELERQDALYSFDADDRADLSSFCMNTGAKVDLGALVSEILEAMERDPGHDATEGIVQPCEDRTRVVEVYQRIIRNARHAAY